MSEQRELLLDILASGAAFKGEVTLSFELASEVITKPLIDPDKEVDVSDIIKAISDTDLFEAGYVKKEPPIKSSKLTKEPKSAKGRKLPKRKAGTHKFLKDEQVWDIRDYIKRGEGDSWIAKKVSCKSSAVWRIRHNKAYTKIGNRPHATVHVGHGLVTQTP